MPPCSRTHNGDVNSVFVAGASALSVSAGLAALSDLWEDVNTRQLCGFTLIWNGGSEPHTPEDEVEVASKKQCCSSDSSMATHALML